MRIGIIGGGAWGTALAQVAAGGSAEVLLWAREPAVVAAINEVHEKHAVPTGRGLVRARAGDRRPGRDGGP